MAPLLTAAIVGLGRVGSRFDEEPGRGIWSHAGAYLTSCRYRLMGGADLTIDNRERFAMRCPDARVFESAAKMMHDIRPDVLSICTPPKGRADLVEYLFSVHLPKVLIAEKPLEIDGVARQRLIDVCARLGVPLLVNYNRRYERVYREVREAIIAGLIGTVTSITVTAPPRLWTTGSHAIDLLLFFAQEAPDDWRVLGLPALYEDGEPAGDLICRFPSGVAGRVLTAGRRSMLVFETEVIGTEGRIRLRDVGTVVTALHAKFINSPTYLGYRTLAEDHIFRQGSNIESTFVTLVDEAADAADLGKQPSCTGDEAAVSENILETIVGQVEVPR
ncbi:MAG: Gfo/Idh/MocA family oxidoreductase [Rhodospirillales bacterium]|nr:Gfo/Idh/MocA family oxidoreductase [Rhodospirillales bacterium]